METSAQVGRGERRRKGSLTIFAGYFSGTGKTYRMLEAAGRAVRAGEDVAVGLLSCSQWPQTQILADGFETLPLKAFSEAGKLSLIHILILVFVVYIFAALTFFPALALGPIAEHLTLWA